MKVLARILVSAAALAVATALVGGITVTRTDLAGQTLTVLAVAVVFGVINTFIRPVVRFLALPLFVLTLGLITFVINALMLLLTSWISKRLGLAFHVDGFGAALLGALIVSIVSFLLNIMLRERRDR